MLSGKVALVTGASRGIGRATAVALAEAGAKVVINYRGNENAALEVKNEIEKIGREALVIKADVASSKEVGTMFEEILHKYGRIDILVNNAGITRDGLLVRMKDEDWEQVLATNLTGVFNCLRAAAKPMMKQRCGKIVNISSVVGLQGNAGQMNYAAAKAGIGGLTKSAAKELAGRGIIVNAVAPGYVDTDMTGKLEDKAKDAIVAGIPLGRVGNPEDIAKVVLFLAGPDSDYITGQIIPVDGGMVM